MAEDEGFKLLKHKDDWHFIDKNNPYLYLDDQNDAELLKVKFVAREKIPLPPKGGKQN